MSVPTYIAPQLAARFGYFPIRDIIGEFADVQLIDMIAANTKQWFPNVPAKLTCYRLDYKTLTLGVAEARDNYNDARVAKHVDAYLRQLPHSISSEQKDLCFYSYSVDDINAFLKRNTDRPFTFLPVTVYPADSANSVRHDMLVIFDNKNKMFYWFDCGNRDDYIQRSADVPKNPIDALFIQLSELWKCGYTYEPSPSWIWPTVFKPMQSVGQIDFIISTAWCYLVVLMMETEETPIAFACKLDAMPQEDRYWLLHMAMADMLNLYNYHKTVPTNSQAVFTDEGERVHADVGSQKPRSSIGPVSMPPRIVPALPEEIINPSSAVPNASQPPNAPQPPVPQPVNASPSPMADIQPHYQQSMLDKARANIGHTPPRPPQPSQPAPQPQPAPQQPAPQPAPQQLAPRPQAAPQPQPERPPYAAVNYSVRQSPERRENCTTQ